MLDPLRHSADDLLFVQAAGSIYSVDVPSPTADEVEGDAYFSSDPAPLTLIATSGPYAGGRSDSLAVGPGVVLNGEGSSQSNPVLPDEIDVDAETYTFTGVQTGSWVDPPLADGFTYSMTGSALFTRIIGFPDAYNDLSIYVDGRIFSPFNSGDMFDFESILGHAVSEFSIFGIDPAIDLADPNAPAAFPLQLEFDALTADFTMSVFSLNAALVPEPTTAMLGVIGLTVEWAV